MKKLVIFALVSLVLAMPALAQPEDGDLGVFFDATGTQTTAVLAGFAVSNFYVVGFNLGGITGWESSVTDLVLQGWNVLGATLNPSNAINVGSVGNFIVGLGACVNAGATHLLVTYQYGYFASPVAPSDVAICIGGTTPSSFGGVPGYSTCQDVLLPFGIAEAGQFCSNSDYPDGCGIVNPTIPNCPVGTTDASWGTVKASF